MKVAVGKVAAAALPLLTPYSPVQATTRHTYSPHAQDLLTQSMSFMDEFYDPTAGYLYKFNTALLHDTRSSSWYAAGLLARNAHDDDDVEQAIKIITNIIRPQFTNASEQWYGDYQTYPEQPYPGTEQYPAEIYNTWDPNWRGFIGMALIVCLEEFDHLLPSRVQDAMLRSLRLNAVGDTYRVGGVDDDNLYPAYSNAAIMKAAVGGWIGSRVRDANLTAESEAWGQEIIDLFDRNGGTLSEFNSPTYTGVSLLGMTLWAKYLPANSTLNRNAARMIRATWEEVRQLYNANMKQFTGPWDRSYGYDESRYVSIMSLWIWSFVGLDASPFGKGFKPWAIAHNDDYEIASLVAVLSDYHRQEGLISETVLRSLTTFDDPGSAGRFFKTSAFSEAYDHVPRNITSWVSTNLTLGAQSFDMNVVGGSARNPSQFNPAVVQWLRKDGSTGFLTLYPETQALHAEVSEGRINLTYPYGNETSKFVFHVSPNGLYGVKNVKSWDDIVGVCVKVSGTVAPKPVVSFCGTNGGSCDPVNEFDLWNFTYRMPAGNAHLPNIVLDFELE